MLAYHTLLSFALTFCLPDRTHPQWKHRTTLPGPKTNTAATLESQGATRVVFFGMRQLAATFVLAAM
jgi:hypothetical protein